MDQFNIKIQLIKVIKITCFQFEEWKKFEDFFLTHSIFLVKDVCGKQQLHDNNQLSTCWKKKEYFFPLSKTKTK